METAPACHFPLRSASRGVNERRKGVRLDIVDGRGSFRYGAGITRPMRRSAAEFVYHLLNRAVGRATLFDHSADDAEFEKVIHQAWQRTQMRLVSVALMANHWHLVVWPSRDGPLGEWAPWLTATHLRRLHGHHPSERTGPIYQGRFKSFPIQENDHRVTLCRYAERNPPRANLVNKNWPFQSRLLEMLEHKDWTNVAERLE